MVGVSRGVLFAARPVVNLAAQRLETTGDVEPDAAQTENAHFPVVRSGAEGERPVLPFSTAHEPFGRGEATHGVQIEPQGGIGHTLVEHVGGVRQRDVALTESLDVVGVVADAEIHDGFQIRQTVQHHRVHATAGGGHCNLNGLPVFGEELGPVVPGSRVMQWLELAFELLLDQRMLASDREDSATVGVEGRGRQVQQFRHGLHPTHDNALPDQVQQGIGRESVTRIGHLGFNVISGDQSSSSSSTLSATRVSVVSTRAAMEAAFCRAERVTFTGSMTPSASRSP